jgi:hypothetical protein
MLCIRSPASGFPKDHKCSTLLNGIFGHNEGHLTVGWRQFGHFRDAELHNVLSAVTVRVITGTSGHVRVVGVGENATCLPC